ncbi:MAG: four helix bundle protein [Vicingaceae bacterium]
MKHRYKNLKIWELGIQIADKVFSVLETFPKEEKFGLISQISRCSISIPSNIAEGSAGTNKSFSYFLSIALGSSFELETQLIISKNRNYLQIEDFNKLESMIHEFQKMTIGFKKSL